jgi:hypothetical protein
MMYEETFNLLKKKQPAPKKMAMFAGLGKSLNKQMEEKKGGMMFIKKITTKGAKNEKLIQGVHCYGKNLSLFQMFWPILNMLMHLHMYR